MPADQVPATTKIKTKSLRHVDTDRLVRRLEYHFAGDHRPILDAENRRPMRDRAREILNVELELIRRVGVGDPDAVAWAWATRQEDVLTWK